ncbi:hypothetical protein C1A50_0955 [Paenibacillus polymyxa]|nr:hypothetical protein C1A50_0955 [Paenibacillus polymyxa]
MQFIIFGKLFYTFFVYGLGIFFKITFSLIHIDQEMRKIV